MKKIAILLVLLQLESTGMLASSWYSAPGTTCSAVSYYCVVKGFDEWSGSCGNERDKKRLYSYLGASAGLKAASLVFDAPYFADNKKVDLWLLKEMGSLYMGMGLYLIESGIKKHRNEWLQQDAKQDLCMGMILMLMGGFHVAVPALMEGADSCTK